MFLNVHADGQQNFLDGWLHFLHLVKFSFLFLASPSYIKNDPALA